jgi:hypothetical protein
VHILKASSVRHGKVSCTQLTQAVEDRLVEGKNLEKILISGHDVHPSTFAVLADVLAIYPHIKNVAVWGAPVGDIGLKCLTQALVAAAGSWYKGSRLLSLELTATNCTNKPLRCLLMALN